MTIDDLITAADPARGRAWTGGTREDARRLIEQSGADQLPVTASGRTSPHQGSRRPARVLIPAGGIVVAVLIAVLAATVSHTGHRPVTPSASRLPPKVVALGPSTAVDRALIGELGILRQPQTAAARRFNTSPKLGLRLAQFAPFIPSLTRAIQLPHRVILFLYVTERVGFINAANHSVQHVRPGGLGMNLSAPFQGFGGCCWTPNGLQQPVGPQITPYTRSQKPDWLYVELVPDGVATVRWIFPQSIAEEIRLPHGERSLTVPVHTNVAAIALPHTGIGGSNNGDASSVTWYNAAGRQIAHHTS
jgi:hypothetical protein